MNDKVATASAAGAAGAGGTAKTAGTLMKALPQKFSANGNGKSSVNTCPGAPDAKSTRSDKPALPIHECDLEAVRVLVRRGKVTRDFMVPAGAGQVAEFTVIDVLANPRKDVKGSMPGDTSTLELTISKYASCSGSKHPLLTLTPGHAPEVECKAVNAVLAKHITPLYRPLRSWEEALINGESFKLFNLLMWFWAAIGDDPSGSVYALVDTCGTRKPGAGNIVSAAELPIRIYPIESYSIGLTIPPLWSGKREESDLRKIADGAQNTGMVNNNQWRREVAATQEDKFAFLDKSSSARTTTSQERQMFGKDVSIQQKHYETAADGQVKATDRTSLDGQMGKLNFSSKPGEDEKPWEKLGIKLELKRNGSDLNFEVGEFLTCVTKAYEALQSFRKGMSSAVQGEASIGLTMSGELNLLTVSLEAAWARKEDKGPRIPWDVNVSLSGKVIDASLTAKYGLTLKYTCLSVKVVEAELSASLTFAGEVSVSKKWNATVMDGQWKWNEGEVPVEGEVSATLAAVGTAMVMGQGVQAKASAKAGIKLESKFKPGESGKPCALEGDINFTGVNVTVTAVDTLSGTRYQSKPIELVASSTLISGFKVGGGA